jgi:hypothetical protein
MPFQAIHSLQHMMYHSFIPLSIFLKKGRHTPPIFAAEPFLSSLNK